MNLLDLPVCMLEQIFEYLSYDEIARKRLVSKQIDMVCQRILNRGALKMIKLHALHLKSIKSQLPRRESERRTHPLSRHADILTCIETRISMLSMTYSKYIDMNLCCFIPGKVIDEVLSLLRLVKNSTKQLRAHEILQELRDISSMAIEHFDEKIAHIFKKIISETHKQKQNYSSTFAQALNEAVLVASPEYNSSTTTTVGNDQRVSSKNCSHVECPEAKSNRIKLHKLDRRYRRAVKKINQMIQIQIKQNRYIRYYYHQVTYLRSQIVDLKRRLEETDAKNREMSANISQIQDKGNESSSPPIRTRNIKPRAATIILKRRITGSNNVTSNTDMKKVKLD